MSLKSEGKTHVLKLLSLIFCLYVFFVNFNLIIKNRKKK